MNLRQYRYFVGVAEELSFSRASERLNISQSALSRQIQLFEADLGLKLFNRIGRGIELTPAGLDLLQRCQTILNDATLIQLRARDLASGSGGLLRIGSTPPALESVVAKVLLGFRRRYPALEIVLTEDGAAKLAGYLDEGRLDVAVMGLTRASTLMGRELARLCVLAVMPARHRFLGQSKLAVADLAAEPLLLLKPQYVTRQLFDGACQVAGIRPNVVIESDSPHSLLTLVRAKLGIAIIPANLSLGDLDKNALPLEHDGKPLEFMLSVVWDSRRYMSPAAEAFVDELDTATRERRSSVVSSRIYAKKR